MKRETREHLNIDEVLNELYHLREENEDLKLQNDFLQREHKRLLSEHRDLTDKTNFQTRQITALKFRCSDYSRKIQKLESEIADMRITRKYLTSEEAGRAFARELLGKPMTPEDIAIEQAENCYVPYNGDDF